MLVFYYYDKIPERIKLERKRLLRLTVWDVALSLWGESISHASGMKQNYPCPMS